ncbi:MAG: VCBS repeat-containing protein [Planctomycetota bacterium]|nr:VCBS repeat-containing protein [Planctomycetota bacterium]
MTCGPVHSLSLTPLLAATLLVGSASAQVWGPKQTVSTGVVGANCVVSHDMDGDGDLDLLATEYSGDRVRWFPQLSPGVFGPGVMIGSGTAVNGAWHCRAGDVDNDGDLDVVVTAAAANTVMLYINQGGGLVWQEKQLTDAANDSGGLTLVDLNMDGWLDVVSTSDGDDKLSMFRNLGGGNFSPQIVLTSAIDGPWALGHGDIDSDGDPDLVVGGWVDASIWLLRNNGTGTMSAPILLSSGISGPSSLRVYDMDSDGDQDVLLAARSSNTVAWLENQGALGQLPFHLIATPSVPFQADAADVDDDGDMDVFYASNGLGRISWHENLGHGNFGPEQVVDSTAGGTRYVSLGDLDDDDDPDLIVSSYNNNALSIHENILPNKKPKVFTITDLHCVESGTIMVEGKNLLGTSATVNGASVPVSNITEASLTLHLGPDIPGGTRDLVLTNPVGTTEWPGAIRRYPMLEHPTTAGLGEPLELLIDNGEEGLYVVAFSGALFTAPAPFTSFGWFYGLELNGVWVLTSGAIPAGTTSKTLSFAGMTTPGLLGIPIHLQAWTAQTALGHAGFTPTTTITFQ